MAPNLPSRAHFPRVVRRHRDGSRIISRGGAVIPAFSSVDRIYGAEKNTAFTISFAMLLAASNATNATSFRIEAVTTGGVTKGGNPVTPGTTEIAAGESFVWTPASDAVGRLDAFTVRAKNAAGLSLMAVQVSSYVFIETGLLADYKLNEGSGTTANDSSANNYDMTLTTPAWVGGRFRGSNGNASYGTLPSEVASAWRSQIGMLGPPSAGLAATGDTYIHTVADQSWNYRIIQQFKSDETYRSYAGVLDRGFTQGSYPVVQALVTDAAGWKEALNGVQPNYAAFTQKTGTPSISGTQYFARSGPNANAGWGGIVGRHRYYSTVLTDTEILDESLQVKAWETAQGTVFTASSTRTDNAWLSVGDSRMANIYGATVTRRTYSEYRYAVSGISSTAGCAAGHNALTFIRPNAEANVLTIFIGVNTANAATVFADIKALGQAAQAMGWKVVVATEIYGGPSGSRDAYKNALNAMILDPTTGWTTFADAVARFDQTPLGENGSYATYGATYWLDDTPGHPNTTGAGLLADVLEVAIDEVTVGPPHLTTIGELSLADQGAPFAVSFDDLVDASDVAWYGDAPALFRVESVLSGTLTKGGNPVVPGVTTLADGESLSWTSNLDQQDDTVDAFTIVAVDNAGETDPVAVPIEVNAPSLDWELQAATYWATSSNGFTTAGIDTRTANVLTLAFVYINSLGSFDGFTDSNGNTWTLVENRTQGTTVVRMYICLNPVTSANHTITFSGSQIYVAPAFQAWAKPAGTPAIITSNWHGTSAGVSSNQAGSVSPTANRQFILGIVGTAFNDAVTNTTVTILGNLQKNKPNLGLCVAWLNQATAAPVDPLWTFGAAQGGSTIAITAVFGDAA